MENQGMNILAIDTSGPVAGCAVMSEGKIVHSASMQHGLTHSETILPEVEHAMAASQMQCSDIDVFAAVAGPGSFTGVRIGVCTVKGLAHAVGKPCVPIHALEALAMNFPGFPGWVVPILDARRNQVYCAAYDVSTGFPVQVLQDDAIALQDLLAALPKDKKLIFTGDGVEKHGETILNTLGENAMLAPANLRDIKPEAVCVLAQRNREAWIPAYELRPVYLRKPQAERERNARLNREAEK